MDVYNGHYIVLSLVDSWPISDYSVVKLSVNMYLNALIYVCSIKYVFFALGFFFMVF